MVVTTREKGCCRHLVGRSQDAATPYNTQDRPKAETYPAHNASSVRLREPRMGQQSRLPPSPTALLRGRGGTLPVGQGGSTRHAGPFWTCLSAKAALPCAELGGGSGLCPSSGRLQGEARVPGRPHRPHSKAWPSRQLSRWWHFHRNLPESGLSPPSPSPWSLSAGPESEWGNATLFVGPLGNPTLSLRLLICWCTWFFFLCSYWITGSTLLPERLSELPSLSIPLLGICLLSPSLQDGSIC